MKKNELKTLKTLIRGIVREEVEFALKKELTEVFKTLKKKPITETKKVVRKRKPMKLAKDPILNKLLMLNDIEALSSNNDFDIPVLAHNVPLSPKSVPPGKKDIKTFELDHEKENKAKQFLEKPLDA